MKKNKFINKIHISQPLVLDSGKVLKFYDIAFETFGKLNKRNPRHEPKIVNEIVANSEFPVSNAKIPKNNEEIEQNPVAIPSILSRKLTEFVIP